jgi:hypothetical protein
MPVIEQLIASIAAERDLLRCDREPLDAATRRLTAAAAKLLRSTSPNDGQIEILLHEMARTLEQVSGLDTRQGPGGTGRATAAPEWCTRVLAPP